MGKYVVKVSLPNKSVHSKTVEDFAFHSEYGSVKIAKEPAGKVPQEITVAGSTTADTTIAHGQSFLPLGMVFAERTPGSGRYYFGSCYQGPEDRVTPVSVNGGVGQTYLDATNLVINLTNNKGTAQTIKLYYFIFGDAGS